ncbi:hypothetical protein ACOMHN_007171 [Nucella lapillus]
MPAQRTKASLGPHSLELLYSKYGPEKLHTSVSPSSPSSNPVTNPTPVTKPTPSPSIHNPGKIRPRRPPPQVLRGDELGDLRKLGGGLSKVERVHLLLDVPPKGHQSQSQAHRPGHSKLQDLKSKLRLVAPRSLPPDKASSADPHSDCSPSARQVTNSVVPLPLLQIRFQCQDSGSRDLSEGRQGFRGVLFPQTFRSSVDVWNFRTPGGSLPARSREFLGSTDACSQFRTSADMPASSGLGRGGNDTDSLSTFDADRVDSQQFDYVFDRFSALSTESDSCTTVTPESDTATFSARAQRPSTTDTVVTHQHHQTRRWSSKSRPLTPIRRNEVTGSPASSCQSPTTPTAIQPRVQASGESWPPRFTVIPSWPALDDPFLFQYLGRGVHCDIMRRLHRSRGGRKRGSQNSHPEDGETTPPPPPPQQGPVPLPLQKLNVVVPTHSECYLCKTYECEHTTPQQGLTTARGSTRPPSLSALSAHSRASECRSRSQSYRPVAGPVMEDTDTSSWYKTCVGPGKDMTFDRGHYTAHNVVN